MLLRTAYLPEAGQPLTCRFDAGPGQSVLAPGEVVWAQGAEKGGEFAIRFTDMDAESVEALKRACGLGEQPMSPVQPGSKVRLHIEGLASPDAAPRSRTPTRAEITVGSDLGFLQVGQSARARGRAERQQAPREHRPRRGGRGSDVERPAARRDAPLLRRAGATRTPPEALRRRRSDAPSRWRRAPPTISIAVDEESMRMKGAVARTFARIGPAFERFAQRAKTTIALLAARRAHARRRLRRAATDDCPGTGRRTAHQRAPRRPRRARRSERGRPAEAAPRASPGAVRPSRAAS